MTADRPSVIPRGPRSFAPPPPLARILFVLGKGGVGKTTVAAGLASAGRLAGVPTAVVEFGDGESGTRALRNAPPGIRHEIIQQEDAITRAATPLLGSSMLAKITLGNFAVKRVLRAAPGLRELAMLDCVRALADENPDLRVIVDMPATGHATSWLTVPAQLRDVARHGPFRDLCSRVSDALLSPDRAAAIVVGIPEPLVLRETEELARTLVEKIRLPLARLIVNRVPKRLHASAAVAARDLIASQDESMDEQTRDAVKAALALLEARSARADDAERAIELLREMNVATPVFIPELPRDPSARWTGELLVGEGLS